VTPFERRRVESELRRFAEERLNAARYPDCIHRFDVIQCDGCTGIALEVAIERHPGDRPGNFRGVLWVTCADCGSRHAAMGVTALTRQPVSDVEHPVCDCGERVYHVARCERWEDWGFFDEGTVVARCRGCGELRALVDTD